MAQGACLGSPDMKQHCEHEPSSEYWVAHPVTDWQGHWVSTNVKWDVSQAKSKYDYNRKTFPQFALPRILRMLLTVVDLHSLRAFLKCCCTCCTARHRFRSPRRGLRLGDRAFLAPAEFGLARSEGRPRSPHGQLVSSGSVFGRTVLSSSALSPPYVLKGCLGWLCSVSVTASPVYFMVWVPR